MKIKSMVIALPLILAMSACSSGDASSNMFNILCWGGGENPALQPPAGLKFIDFDVHGNFGCAINTENDLLCWGEASSADDRFHQLIADYPIGLKARSISLSLVYGCVVDMNYKPACWSGGSEQLTPPDNIVDGRTFTDVIVKNETACALSDEAHVYCWGKVSQEPWVATLQNNLIEMFDFDNNSACWSVVGKSGYECSLQEPYTVSNPPVLFSSDETPRLMRVVSEYTKIFTDKNVMHFFKELALHSEHPNLVDFQQVLDFCFLRPNGNVFCENIKGTIPRTYTMAQNVPENKFERLEIGLHMACGATKHML